MLNKTLFICCLALTQTQVPAQEKNKPLAVIFDSDMGPDYDDVGAITLLHGFADSGYVKILATVASTKYEGVAGVFSVFNTYFKRPLIPIGVPRGSALTLRDSQHWTDTLLQKYPHSIKLNNEVPDAVEVYRMVLARQPDHEVTIITVGFVTNLAALLRSRPDKYSKLTGEQLVKKKVKQLVCMAGRFPAGSEFNLDRDAASSQYVFTHWETPVMFSGVEIGFKIRTGLPLINDNNIRHSPVKDVFRICIPLSAQDSAGRMSWDETAVLLAVKGCERWWNLVSGKILIADNGSNSWTTDAGSHYYITEKCAPAVVENYINQLLMHQPAKKD